MRAALLLLLAACGAFEDAGHAAKHLAGSIAGEAAEYTICPLGVIDCGHVFQCAAPADTPSGHVELCIDDDDQPEQFDEIEAAYGTCEPTPRHEGLCIWCPSGAGCNAYSGCWGCP